MKSHHVILVNTVRSADIDLKGIQMMIIKKCILFI